MSQHSELNWKTADGLNIFAQAWSPEVTPRAVVALAHGLGEHSGRYAHVAKFFAAAGIATVAYDRRGHGKSDGKRGHAPTYAHYYDEIADLLVQTRRLFPNMPVILYGHSMGGNIALNYILRNKISDLAGVISSASVIQLAFKPNPFIVAVGRLTLKIYPSFTQNNQLDVNNLSRDPKVVAAYVADPLVHDRLTSVAGLGIIDAAQYLSDHPTNFPVPLYITHGGNDKVTSAPGSVWFANNYNGDITLRIWNELYHEIHNEPEQLQVLNEMLIWINGKI
jgi:alpha-beta hydrolase superfamily lysophospholipase